MEGLASYERLARRLDALPNGFPPSLDGVELRLLAHLFTPEEADLAAGLRLTPETPEQLAGRLGGDPAELRKQLKGMVRRGLISAGAAEGGGLGYKLMPFVVGIYEMQVDTLDAEMAGLFEQYYRQSFGQNLAIQPSVHRVIPVEQAVQPGIAVRPYESAAEIVAMARAWGVLDCICRKQKALIGEGCSHPIDVCMCLSAQPGAFDRAPFVRVLTQDEALATLRRAAEAGLVHSVSNHQKDIWYICNCCTCSCGILRGMADLGLAGVVAHSGLVNQVDHDRCQLCGACVDRCPFGALALGDRLEINSLRCAGCGVCGLVCPDEALQLVPRAEDMPLVPETERDWLSARAQARGRSLDEVL